MTKKQKKEENRKKRNFWTRSPITKIKQSDKLYNRQKFKREGKNDD